MIQPEDIRRKAENLYGEFVRAWLAGNGAFFPRLIPAQRDPDPDSAVAINAVRALREASKEVVGFGYTVEWREINSRRFGRNQFPARIIIDTQEDFLRLTGRVRDFRQFQEAVTAIRTRHTVLEGWIRSNVVALTELAPEVSGLLEVVEVLQRSPRPGCFARELPVAVDTKFVERHQNVLRQWLDQVLPPHAIRADEEHFERRYGLRYAEPHLLVRFLDSETQQRLGFPCDVLSLPLHTLGTLQPGTVPVLIVENKVNLLTVPRGRYAAVVGGLGDGVSLLRYVPWLATAYVTYWGDLDVEGLEILSALRMMFPQAQSVFMDETAVATWRHLAVAGTGRAPAVPPHLTQGEKSAFLLCAAHNLRSEQERIPQAA
ncbi:MAG: DUF3322 domain-containing protein, partial [Phycisphaerae bacterium]